MSVVMLQRAGEEKSTRVQSPRGAARGRFVSEKNGPKKIVQKSDAELKTPRKWRKSRRLWFFHSWRVSKKKEKERGRKRDREVPLGITVQQDHSSLCTLVTSSGWSHHKDSEFTDRFYRIFATTVLVDTWAAAYENTSLEKLSSLMLLSSAKFSSGARNVISVCPWWPVFRYIKTSFLFSCNINELQ